MSKTDNSVALKALKHSGKPSEKFNALLQSFMQHPLKPGAAARHYNSAGFSKERLETLIYDVKKVYEISDVQLREFNPEPEKERGIKIVGAGNTQDAFVTEALKELLDADLENLDYHKELKPLAANVANELGEQIDSFKTEDLKNYLRITVDRINKLIITPANTENFKTAVFEAPEDVKTSWKLRDEYPFLNDDNCPDKLHTLVGKMITAHVKYEEGREVLKAAKEASNEEIYELAAPIIENFELNKEIKEELDHYKEHGEILGNHPIFEEDMLQKKVEGYKATELSQKRGNLRSYITKNNPKLEAAKDAESKAAIQKKLDDWQAEIDLIEKRLDGQK